MCNLAYKHKKAEEKIHSFVYPPTITSPTQQGFRNVFLALYLFFLEPLPSFFLVLFSPSRPELCKAVFRQLSVEKVRVKNLLVVRLDAQRVLGRLHVVVAGKLVGGQVVHFRPSPSSSIDNGQSSAFRRAKSRLSTRTLADSLGHASLAGTA